MSQPQPACLSAAADQANELDVSSFTGAAGYAVLDGSGCLLDRNARLSVLLGDDLDKTPLPEAVAHGFGADPAREVSTLVASPEAASLTLTGMNGSKLQIQLGRLQGNRRLLVIHDIDQEKRQNTVADEDALTGLANRHQLSNALSQLDLERTVNAALPPDTDNGIRAAAVLLIDIDRFKQVNDTLGHIIGDALLRLLSSRLRRLTRDTDRLIRVGGDEFLLVLPADSNPDEVDQIAQRMIELIARPFLVSGHQVNTGASIGVARFDSDVTDAATLLQNADLALQEAKSAGRNRVCHFRPSMAQAAHQRRELEIDLRRALSLKQFRLVYQPQVDMHTGRLAGFEALLRWDHPVRGAVSPVDFIPIAEDTGEIRRIGAWVLLEACRHACLWPDDLTIAVNVSPLQFDDGTLVAKVRQALHQSGLPAERLEVEVTEGLLFHNPEAAESQLNELRRLGVDIAMDDFGTGYSSLSHLSRFPFTKVKIDQSFVRGDVDRQTHALVSTIIQLGVSLGMKTLAEGVETTEQYQRLADSGCDAVQGYLISRPMEATATIAFVEQCDRQFQERGSGT